MLFEQNRKDFMKSKCFKLIQFANNNSISLVVSTTIKICRGFFIKKKFHKCGNFLIASKGLKIFSKNGLIDTGSSVVLWPSVKLSVVGTEIHQASLKIGDFTTIGNRTEIHCGKEIVIGQNCLIGWDVIIMDRDYHKINSNSESLKSVHISNNVWIGSRSIILKGTTIGEGSVVGAGSVVTRDVPCNVLVTGNPAKVIKENISWKP